MLFIHTHEWIWGNSPHTGKPKRQTRRVAAIKPDGTACEPPYKVGRSYAVQAKFMGKAIGRIQITERKLEKPEDISGADAIAEGFASPDDFLAGYNWINRERQGRLCWAYTFEPEAK